MAIKLENKPNVDAPDSDYPFGKIRDKNGATPGTPVNTEVYGDFHQFFAKLMDVALIAYNDLPDNDYSGFQFYEALVTVIRGLAATETEKGTAEIATQTEVNTGTDDVRFVTPKKIKDGTGIIGTTALANNCVTPAKVNSEIAKTSPTTGSVVDFDTKFDAGIFKYAGATDSGGPNSSNHMIIIFYSNRLAASYTQVSFQLDGGSPGEIWVREYPIGGPWAAWTSINT